MSPSASETAGRTIKAMDLEELVLELGIATPALREGETQTLLRARLAEKRSKPVGSVSEDTWALTARMVADRRRECFTCIAKGTVRPVGHSGPCGQDTGETT